MCLSRNGSRDQVGTEVYPGCDGKVCLPEAQLCATRTEKVAYYVLGYSYFNLKQSETVASMDFVFSKIEAEKNSLKPSKDLNLKIKYPITFLRTM